MSTQLFDQQLGDLAASLGDTTRRGIYLAVRESSDPVTAARIAESFAIHPNVARHHLERLVADGYLEVTGTADSVRRAGRPAKRYAVSGKEVSLQFPSRRYDLLAELLVRVIERIDPDGAADAAEAVGREFGIGLAREIGLPDEAGFEEAARSVAHALLGVGFETSVDSAERRLVTRLCPFGVIADDHPDVVCRLDQGIVRGLLEAANQGTTAVVTRHGPSDAECVTDV
jgi:predicted ArsR family transcriptional regulator